jgi:ADP-ribose pyrophosphatase YjhB (NUDIX family)
MTPYTSRKTINGQTVCLTFFEPPHAFDAFRAKRLIILAFDRDGKILMIRKQGKLSLITGRVGFEDMGYEDAAWREAREDARVTLGPLQIAAIIESRPKYAPTAAADVTLALAAHITYIDPDAGTKRHFLTKEEIAGQRTAHKPKDLMKLIEMADFVLPAASGDAGTLVYSL